MDQPRERPLAVAITPNDGSAQLTTPTSSTPVSAGNNGGQSGAAAPKDQMPGHPSFRRQRASRACETCHARKVRCDAASLGVPCTNCVAFSIECKIPAPKRKKTGVKKDNDSEPIDSQADDDRSPAVANDPFPGRGEMVMTRDIPPEKIGMNTSAGMPKTEGSDAYYASQQVSNGTYAQYMKPKFARAPIKEAGRVAYLGESSNLSLLVQDRLGATDVVHYPLPENVRGARARINELDNVEIDILHQRGAFLLPPRQLCDELVDAFFTWIAPVVPVINRSKFMRRYRDTKNPPSLLLLQAILLAGSRVCSNPQLMDANGSTTPAAMTFYKRAKALYDANYEDDRVTIVQALILMGWYWEGPEGKGLAPPDASVMHLQSDVAADVTKNVFYWSRVAVIVAQGSGMHRSVEQSQLSKADKRLWKRIWWTLFTRDRSVAVALGRPVSINIDDSDVEMVTEDDFIDDEPDRPAEFPPDPTHVHFFLNYVKLCEIMGLVLSQQYSVAKKERRNNALDLTHSDMALADWLQNCPPEVRWEPQRHHFWSALLQSNYYTILCLLHRAHMPPAGAADARPMNGYPEETAYPSRGIAYQAAAMITSIIETLQKHDQLRYTPAFIVYSLFSALIMHVYQMRSSSQTIVSATQARLTICMNALKDVSKVWLVAKMVHTLFESILGNKALEERLQKAAGRRHAKNKPSTAQRRPGNNAANTDGPDAQKRKFDDMEMGYSNGPPAPQMSYERSRPQSPVLSPSQGIPPGTHAPDMHQLPNIAASSPVIRQGNDAFMGRSRPHTRPGSPFNGFSIPGTPPDFFLHTRGSPKISEDLWQNYQPDQLFPPEANSLFPVVTNSPAQNMVDPALRGGIGQQQFNPQHLQSPSQLHAGHMPNMIDGSTVQPMDYHHDATAWTSMNQANTARSDDVWSNSSSTTGGPIVPTTLNVGDWFEFFGIQNAGDLNGLNGLNGASNGYG
ncbi:cutinase transcription factor 1 alpha like protein [Zymoseptoria brevis]|uniref:Cutinase transcription factor 1 alpha like protein n=1 Tax=Zymoseptoria brevis TaxID=1047168 RepID=A0A0F4GR95_9PEZI|nr:cutinase transcription factor 1 alpha like protein [Zymoseptoria brevis]